MLRVLLGSSGTMGVVLWWFAGGGALTEPAGLDGEAEELFPESVETAGWPPLHAGGPTDMAPPVEDSFPDCDFDRVSRYYTRISPRPSEDDGLFQGKWYSSSVVIGCGGGTPAEFDVRFQDGTAARGVELRDGTGRLLGRTDADGRYRSEPGVVGGAASETWSLGGRALFRKGWEPGPPGTDDAFVLWSGGRAIDGRVVDQHGLPVPGATITIEGEDDHTVTADDAGRFAIADCTPSAMPRPVVSHPDCFAEPMLAGAPEGKPGSTTALTVRAVRGRRHWLRLHDDGGQPRAGATVEWTWRWPDAVDGERPEWTDRATTNRAGVAELLLVPGAALDATIEHAGTGRVLHGLAGLLPDRLAVELRSTRAQSWIPFRCLDGRTGAMVRPSRVLVRRAEQPWIVGEPIAAVRDAICHPHDGLEYALLDLDDLPRGVWEIWAWSPGYAPCLAVAQATDGGVYPAPDLQMRRGGGTLRVQALVGGKPIFSNRVTVSLRVAGAPDAFRHASRFDQEIEIDGLGRGAVDLPPGEYEVHAECSDRAPMTRRVTVGADDQPVEIRF